MDEAQHHEYGDGRAGASALGDTRDLWSPSAVFDLKQVLVTPLEGFATPSIINGLSRAVQAVTYRRTSVVLFSVSLALGTVLVATILLGLVSLGVPLPVPIFGFLTLFCAAFVALIMKWRAVRMSPLSTPESKVLREMYVTFDHARQQLQPTRERLIERGIPAGDAEQILDRQHRTLQKAYLAAIIEVTHYDGEQRSSSLQRNITESLLRIRARPAD